MIGVILVLLIAFSSSYIAYGASSEFSIGAEQTVGEAAVIDVTNINRGYLMCLYTGRAGNAVIVVNKSDNNKAYRQSIDNNGEYMAIPFLYGDGRYSILIWEQLYGTSYRIAARKEVYVTLDDERLPFLYPNRVVPIKPDSLAVMKGYALTKGAETDPEKIAAIYTFIVVNIGYDDEKAATVKPGYVSDPDETIRVKEGICIDYAVLAATMLRSQGIPTKIECGYMANGVYHAWISVYSDQAGTITDLFELKEKEWTMLDPTFAANDETRTAAMLRSAAENGDYITFFVY